MLYSMDYKICLLPPPPPFFCLKWLSVIAIYQRSGGSWTSSCACEQICPQIISLTLFLARRGHHTFILPTIPYCPYLNDRYSAQSRLISLVMAENNIWVDDTAHAQYIHYIDNTQTYAFSTVLKGILVALCCPLTVKPSSWPFDWPNSWLPTE